MIPKYEDFFLIVDGSPGSYTVEAQGPGEIRVSPVPFGYHETDELRVELNRIKSGFAPSRERMQQVGEMLFKALFPYEIIPAFMSAKTSLPEGTYLRLKLITRPAALSHLPWELTYDILDKTFLAARTSRPIVRYVEQGTPPASLLARRPLRVLYLQANPKGTTPLDTAASEGALRNALGEDGEVTSVRNTTPEALRDVLREQSFHALHYDGHSKFDEASGRGRLYLHDGQDRAHLLDGEMLATYLDGSSIRLVVLSACETAVDSKEKRFSGIAQQLMRTTRLPAAVAMQYEIPDASAIAFSREFYEALADDYPVDAAVVEGRKAILEISGGDPFAQPDWATPVLFMRVKDGDIFRGTSEEGMEMGEEKRDRPPDVDTGGGAYIGGSVTVSGGDFVGRDKVVHGDEVHGDKVGGDKVEGDKITVGDVSGTGIAIGRGAQAAVTQGLGGQDIATLFAAVYQQIETRPEDPDVDKAELTETVQKVEAEAAKGEEASPKRIERWLKYLGSMAPDVLDVTVACLTNPVAGVATVIRKIAEKAKGQARAA
jgi:hypothetical protein